MVCSLLALIFCLPYGDTPLSIALLMAFMSAFGVPSIAPFEEPFVSEFVSLFVSAPDDVASPWSGVFSSFGGVVVVRSFSEAAMVELLVL